MSELKIYQAAEPTVPPAVFVELAAIAGQLDRIGVRFERWSASQPLAADADQDAVLAAYREPVERLMRQYGFQSADVVALGPAHPDKAALRAKFLDEHTHDDYEVRFFVEGQGLFYLHVGERVYGVLCERGDLLSVPAHTTHWFDMGPNPSFKCIRLFTTPEGWVAQFTGRDIAQRFPRLDP
ncbi:MAG TPA: cupin [Candidatus Competibacteraceae bacterium]|nr:MAG: cupin [Candidatus Competibacteraceae bacterium]HOB61259.1 cupin [Candidatus Competibacteraceae bacterium]HQA24576.1 cupin [Candidatus Competibacteraceae bacterium]HQD55654.1 cupin [Candidatus Competibacteraceae bacterium]